MFWKTFACLYHFFYLVVDPVGCINLPSFLISWTAVPYKKECSYPNWNIQYLFTDSNYKFDTFTKDEQNK